MRILHIQFSMTPAGNAAYRLHRAMLDSGLDSKILLLSPHYQQADCYNHYVFPIWAIFRKIINSLYRRTVLGRQKEGTYLFSGLPLVGLGINSSELVKQADVIYLHWVAGMSLSSSDFKALCDTKKLIVFFMHDMWDITGGCHHSFECKQYSEGCKDCPMFLTKKHAAQKQLYKRAMCCQGDNVFFVSPGDWLGGCAKKSVISKGHEVFVIPNIVNLSMFKPIEKSTARQHFKLPVDKRIISFGCISGDNPFKGWMYLKEAIEKLDIPDLHIVVYGGDFNKKMAEEIKYPISFVGRITKEEELALISNVADVFINPSLCENYSSVLLEHILCRVPVIAFNYTGNPNLVQTGITGYLAKYKDSEDLSRGISMLLNGEIVPTFDFHYSSEEIINKHKMMISKYYEGVN